MRLVSLRRNSSNVTRLVNVKNSGAGGNVALEFWRGGRFCFIIWARGENWFSHFWRGERFRITKIAWFFGAGDNDSKRGVGFLIY